MIEHRSDVITQRSDGNTQLSYTIPQFIYIIHCYWDLLNDEKAIDTIYRLDHIAVE